MITNSETAAMIFGRFQGITKAHAEMFHFFHNYCKERKIYEVIFISPSTDKKKNPLSLGYRYYFLHKLFPYNNFVADERIKEPFSAICELGRIGFKRIIMMAGSDRIKRFKEFSNYINHPDPEKCIPNVQEIEVIPFGIRDENSDDLIESVSATKARQAVKDKDFVWFTQLIPECNIEDQIQLYINIRKGLGLDATPERTPTKFQNCQ